APPIPLVPRRPHGARGPPRRRGRSGTDQLFNLADDLREQADRAKAEPERLAELRASWERTDAGLLPYPTTP
ncbi:hypothetical protein ACM9HB_29305, partial [Streptomyces sp. JAC128]